MKTMTVKLNERQMQIILANNQAVQTVMANAQNATNAVLSSFEEIPEGAQMTGVDAQALTATLSYEEPKKKAPKRRAKAKPKAKA